MTKITVEITDNYGGVIQSASLSDNDDGMTACDLVNMFGHVMLALTYERQTINEVLNTDEFFVED
jgi:hypothetical protein